MALEEAVFDLVAKGVGVKCSMQALFPHFQQQLIDDVLQHKTSIREAASTAVEICVRWDQARQRMLNYCDRPDYFTVSALSWLCGNLT